MQAISQTLRGAGQGLIKDQLDCGSVLQVGLGIRMGLISGFFLLSQLPWRIMEWKVLLNGEITGKLLLILLRIKYNLPVPMRGGEREREKKGVAITDSHRLSRKGKRVKPGVAWRILFWYEVSGLEWTMIFILLYGVSRQQNPSRPINATDHRTSFSLVLSQPPYNVLYTTYQESLMYNIQYIYIHMLYLELLSLRGWFHRHFAKQNDALYILPTLWPRNLTHTGRRSTSTGVEKCTRADVIGSHNRESLELEFMCS